jgi:hypothetical protein
MGSVLVILVLALPFVAIAALVCWLIITIGGETSKGK